MFKKIFFRSDSSSAIGIGHIMRDLVLAKTYYNSKIIFGSLNLTGNINNKIVDAGYKLVLLQSNSIQELDSIIKKFKIDLLIIDNYSIDYHFEKELKKKNPQLKIMVLDDTYEKHNCDILLNHNIYADKKKYKELVPQNCKLQCGGKYTLLREEFLKEKNKLKKKTLSLKQDIPITIFLAMGGADSYNMNINILKILKKLNNIKINLVTTNSNNNLKQLKIYCKNKAWINLHINSNKIAKLMVQSDVGIITPSVIVNEIIHLQIPFISIKVTNNQEEMYRFLKKNNFYTLTNKNITSLNKYIKKILLQYDKEKVKIRKILK